MFSINIHQKGKQYSKKDDTVLCIHVYKSAHTAPRENTKPVCSVKIDYRACQTIANKYGTCQLYISCLIPSI